jgi:glycosyltransferase involved in cell wall biosynthesis
MKTIVIAIFIREKSAITEYFQKLSEKLIEHNYHIIILTNEQRTDLIDKNSNPTILTWPSYYPTKLKDFLFIKDVIKEYKPIAIISNFSATNFSLIAGKLFGVPNRIVWIHTISTAMMEVDNWKFTRKRFIYKLATHFIANSNATKKDAIERYKIDKSKIDVLYNLIYRKDNLIAKEKTDEIIFVGRFYKAKGIDVLIRAMAIVKKEIPNIKLRIIGGGDSSSYEKMIKEHELEDNIIIEGRISRDEVFAYLSKAKFSIVPSLSEAFGFVVIEAFSMKTTVIGSNIDGISEIIQDKENGLLFEVGNHKDLAEKMLFLWNNPKLIEKYSSNAYETFLNKFELNNKIEEATQTILKEIDI